MRSLGTPTSRLVGLVGLLAWLLAGCGGMPAAPPPTNSREYATMSRGLRTAYPPYTVLLYNLQRVMDPKVPAAARAESVKVVERLGAEDPAIRQQLVTVLSGEDTPEALRDEILHLLIQRDYPGIAGHVVRVLPDLRPGDRLHTAVLNWLTRHPTPEVLAEVVALWAREPRPTVKIDRRYERVVGRLAGTSWDAALLGGINQNGFGAKGSALRVLVRRLAFHRLRERIQNATPRTRAMLALQTFLERFDYLPRTSEDFLSVVALYESQDGKIGDAAGLYHRWVSREGYVFDIRDYHLLAALSRDPLRPARSRSDLVLAIGRALGEREHVRHASDGRGRKEPGRFWLVSPKLRTSDLWNLYLINEMLSRRRIQLALSVDADRDLADGSSAWGGLVVYANGQAELNLYPPRVQEPPDDMVYVPNRSALIAGRDALCRFVLHFEKIYNARRAGPGEQELRDARLKNYYGLVLTSLTPKTFCAHYYNPSGQVVSLGVFPFLGERRASEPATK